MNFKDEEGIINIDKTYKIYVNRDKQRISYMETPTDVIFAEIYNEDGNDYYILKETDINKVMKIINSNTI